MRFLVDESAGSAIAAVLGSLGHDVLVVAEIMPQAEDAAILARAVQELRIVVTNDKDFGELIFRSGQPHAGVVLLRLRDESSANRVRVMQAVLGQCTGGCSASLSSPPSDIFASGRPRDWTDDDGRSCSRRREGRGANAGGGGVDEACGRRWSWKKSLGKEGFKVQG